MVLYQIKRVFVFVVLIISVMNISCETAKKDPSSFTRLKYNNPGLHVDLGVGLWAWPIPMDYDQDGDNDLLVCCPDVPYNGIHFFENTDGNKKMPVFKPGVKVGPGYRNIQVSYVHDRVRVLLPGKELSNYRTTGFTEKTDIYTTDKIHEGSVRANQWKYCDWEGDGDLDLIVGVGDWSDYGWDNAFDSQGRWTRGPLHGYVYLIKNNGNDEKPKYSEPKKITTAKNEIDVYGMPSPNLADFDGDGDLDLLCGEFLDKFTYFENKGTRQSPKYAEGKILTHEGQPITMDLEMIVPVAIDWDKDGDVDLIVGQEDGRVAFIENTGMVSDGLPQFLLPKFFLQQAMDVKFGALVTPFSYDWDADGDEDLICGNTAGYIGFIENLDGDDPPQWAEPKYLEADNEAIRIQAGYNGSIQGPCEAKWGYTTVNVADWDHDGLHDVIINSIWGEVLWYKNVGTREKPVLQKGQPIQVEWKEKVPKPAWNWWNPKNNQLVTQWRTTPVVIDWNRDKLNDLIMLDHEGYLSLFKRAKEENRMFLMPGKRIFYAKSTSIFNRKHELQNNEDGILRLNDGQAGRSGRRKFCFADWNQDGLLDLLVNSQNISWMRAINDSVFQNMGKVDSLVLAGHTTSPTTVDWDRDDIPDLLVGAEDGFLYYKKNTYDGN